MAPSDRYAKIREALEKGPTPGPLEWKEGQSVITREWDGKDLPLPARVAPNETRCRNSDFGMADPARAALKEDR